MKTLFPLRWQHVVCPVWALVQARLKTHPAHEKQPILIKGVEDEETFIEFLLIFHTFVSFSRQGSPLRRRRRTTEAYGTTSIIFNIIMICSGGTRTGGGRRGQRRWAGSKLNYRRNKSSFFCPAGAVASADRRLVHSGRSFRYGLHALGHRLGRPADGVWGGGSGVGRIGWGIFAGFERILAVQMNASPVM